MRLLSLLLLVASASAVQAQSLSVTNVSPASHTLSTDPNHEIEITFDAPVDPATISEQTFMVFGRWSGPMTGTIEVSGDAMSVNFTPDGDFFYGEYLAVMLTNAVEGAGGESLEHGYIWNYWTKTLPGSMVLPEVETIEMKYPEEVWIQCYGAYAGDINNDNFSDLVVVNEDSEDLRILLNDGTGHFEDFIYQDLPFAQKPSTNEAADFNHDGEIDLAIGSRGGDEMSVMIGNGDGTFQEEVYYEGDEQVRGLAVLDFEGDGYMDVATANRVGSNMAYFRNNQDGTFAEIGTVDLDANGETATMAADFNEDGLLDLGVGAYQGSSVMVLISNGDGTFTLSSEVDVNANPWMIGCGDVNGDGHVDLVSANAGGGNMSVHFGDGMGNLGDPAYYPTGSFPLAVDLGDLDGDGDLDMISSNYSGVDFTLYENDGTGVFMNPITYDAEAAGSCAIFHDRNNDGVMDLTAVDEIADVVILYENSAPTQVGSIDEVTWSVSPNPASNTLNFTNLSVSNQLALYDGEGRLVRQIVSNSTDISDLPTGHYFVRRIDSVTAPAQQLIIAR